MSFEVASHASRGVSTPYARARTPRVTLAILAGLVIFFAAGLVRLLATRIATGDVYPELSSLSPARFGAKAFYESLAALPNFSVRRNFQDIEKIPSTRTTVFFLDLWPDFANTRDLDSLAVNGARIVIAAPPVAKLAEAEKNRWGFHLAVCPLTDAETTANRRNGHPLFTGVFFARLDPAWHVIETARCGATVMERAFGKGTIVLAANALLFSNEALTRNTQTIASVIGPNRSVVFDESHFGIQENPGIASLARRYRLHWAVVAGIALALLFVWRNASDFPPPAVETTQDEEITNQSSFGLAQLLRRSVSPQDLLAAYRSIADK